MAGADLAAVHDRLRAILSMYRDRLHVAADGPGGMTLELPACAGKPWGFAAGTRVGKRYVSHDLMGVYGDPTLEASISRELRRRMQGRSCFNFTTVDEPLLRGLATLTRTEHRPPARRRRSRPGRQVAPLTLTQGYDSARPASLVIQ